MALTEYKLGDLITRVERRNSDLLYGVDDVRGVMNTKGFMPTRANIEGRSLNRFLIVKKGEFAFNRRTTRNGERLGLGYNDTENTYIVTEDYVSFSVAEHVINILSPDYLYIFFLRNEFDRWVRYDSWGSATEFFNWEEMCDVSITLPSLDVQQKYAAVYNAMLANQRAFEEGLEDLKLTCDAFIERLRHELPHEAIGDYIQLSETKNDDLRYGIDSVKGVSNGKRFIDTKADMTNVSLKPYLIVEPNAFAYVTVTSRNGEKISLAHNGSGETYLCSSSYVVFSVKNKEKLVPSYLRIFFSRPEFDRYVRFQSWGSARETFVWEDMRDVKIPIPDVAVQCSIIGIYNTFLARREINERLKEQIKDLCPILIKGSIEEGAG
jgi:type I restriction enzyme S subunit